MFLKKWLGQFFQICINIASFAGFCILVAKMQLFMLLCSCNIKTWYPDCFNEHGVQNVKLQIIDQVNEGNHEGLKRKDGFWQHQLMTFIDQGGLNSKDDLDEEDFRR